MKTDTIFKLGVCIELTLFLRKLFLFHDKNKSVKYNVIVKYFNNFSRHCIKPPIHGYDKKNAVILRIAFYQIKWFQRLGHK